MVCHRLFEDGGHLLLRCSEVKNRWRVADLEDWWLTLTACVHPLEIMDVILRLPSDQKLCTVCLLCSWWAEGNKCNHGDSLTEAESFSYRIKSQVMEWK